MMSVKVERWRRNIMVDFANRAIEHRTRVIHVRLGTLLSWLDTYGEGETFEEYADITEGLYDVRVTVGRTEEQPAGQVAVFEFPTHLRGAPHLATFHRAGGRI